ncbi:methyl-accepting chemotaxis protein [Roseateles puraquae]|uniref:methyl-accepting chemotaxis protein n=1 Tax=Roseateles puraquae TaxID=431059 RepID=UPI001303485C|nr:methyl-accepting chemotaxis protein [Roseateles puraquae]
MPQLLQAAAAGAPIVTVTDAQGRITYANSAFQRASGLAVDQAVGAPHSVVRHPEMPARVFADLWASLRRGQPWTGLIRNRHRDGRDYWVQANVIPARRGDEAIGYTSIQLPPSRDEIERAEAVYRAWQAGHGSGHQIRQGRIVETGWTAWMRALRNPLDLPVQRRVQGSAGLLAMLFAAGVGGALAPQVVAGLLAGLGGWQAWAVAGGLLGIVASGAIAVYFQGRIVTPLRASCDAATAIAGGDIHRPFDDSPQAGELRDLNRALNQLVAKMAAVLRDAHDHSVQVGEQVAGLADGAERLAVRSAEQSGDVGDVAQHTAAIDGLSTGTAESARLAHEMSQLATAQADEACAIARTLQASMQDISAFGERIGEISGRIDGISVQTGILALNAAAAASRDRELGRTFAVVAAEVRSLARGSGEAAQQIRALSGESRDKTEAGLRLAQAMADKVDGAAQRIRALGEQVAQIRQAAQAQSEGVQQINDRLRALDGSTRLNATLARDSVDASAQARQETARLQAAIGVWHLD